MAGLLIDLQIAEIAEASSNFTIFFLTGLFCRIWFFLYRFGLIMWYITDEDVQAL